MTDPITIITRVAECFGVTPSDIVDSRRRNEPLATARKAAMVLVARAIGNRGQAARLFRRDANTICHAERTTTTTVINSVLKGMPMFIPSSRPSQKVAKEVMCDCGNPAVKRDNAGPVCQRCLDIEAQRNAL